MLHNLDSISETNSQVAMATDEQNQAVSEANMRISDLAGMADASLSNTQLLTESSNELIAGS